jgi:hypothetical protein
MGFDGATVTPHIRTVIEEFQVGSILLTAKNCKCERCVSCVEYHVALNSPLTYPSCRGDNKVVL